MKLLILLILLPTILFSQKVEIIIKDHQLDSSQLSRVHVEPHIATNSRNPQHLVAASIVLDTTFTSWSSSAFTSFDGGNTWSRYNFEMERCIDPWVTINEDGSVFITAIEILRNVKNDERFNLLLFNSSDGGITWNKEKNSLGRGFDHEIIIPATNSGMDYYMTTRKARDLKSDSTLYDISLWTSANNGSDFQLLSQFRPENVATTINPTGIVENTDGSLVISFIEFPSFYTRSIRSIDGGKTFNSPLLISDKCQESPTFPGYPYLSNGQKDSPFRHQVYHTCISKDFDGIWLSVSENAGQSWKDAIRLDTPPNESVPHVRTPMLAVNKQGIVALAWYDRRNDPDNNCQDIYFTASMDGGNTFVSPVRISTEISCPNSEGNGQTYTSWPGGGDYSSMTTDSNGLFHIIWSDSRNGTAQLRHSAINVD